MSRTRRTRIRPNQRDLRVLEHVARYRMTLPEAVARLPIMEDARPTGPEYALRRLREFGWLESDWLYGQTAPRKSGSTTDATRGRRCYHFLSATGAKHLELPPKAAGPLKTEPKIRAYGTLHFCCLSEPQRHFLTFEEYKAYYAHLHRQGERINYYLDPEYPKPRLGSIRVDCGKGSRWDRLIASCRRDFASRCNHKPFRDHVTQYGFVITVVTAFQRKAQRLQGCFSDMQLPFDVKLHVVPDLIQVIAPLPDDEGDEPAREV